MHVVRKILWLLLAFPAAAILIALAVANRHPAVLKLDPFKPDNPVISLNLPLFAYIFAALFAGMALGAFATWLGQGKWRKRLRERTQEAHRWHSEAHSLKRQMKAAEGSARGLPAPGKTAERQAVG